MAAKREYLCLGSIYLDDQLYAPGSVIELTDDQAEPVLRVKQVQPIDQNNDGVPDRAESERPGGKRKGK